MKKYFVAFLLLLYSVVGYSQATQWRLGIDSATGNVKVYHDTIISLLRTPLNTINAYGNFFASNTDSIGIEGATNLWFTNARARAAVSLSFTTTGTSGAATGTYNSSTGLFSFNIPQYSGATYTATTPVTLTGSSFGMVNQGTTSTVLHGNASGNASFGAVSLTADIIGILPVANGGTGTASPGIVAGTNITVTGTWPNQTVNSSGGSGWNTSGGNTGTHYPDTSRTIGTNDATALRLITNGIQRISIDSLGKVEIGAKASYIGPVTDYKINTWGTFALHGNNGDTSDAVWNINPSGIGNQFDMVSKSVTTGSGNTIRPVGYLIFTPSGSGINNSNTVNVLGINAAGGVSVGVLNDNSSIFNVNAVNFSDATLGFNINGRNRVVFKDNGTSGDFTLTNGTTIFDVNGTTLNTIFGGTTDVPGALLQFVSTTKGAINAPIQTVAQRDQVTGTNNIATGTAVGGSGYTNGTYNNTVLTGGTGVSATANITVSGGAITGVALVNKGSRYTVGDVLTASGLGAGTGFTYTVNSVSTGSIGVEVYNSTTHQSNTWNGGSWTNDFTISSAATLSLLHGGDYVFTGTTSTWTLPAISASLQGRQNGIYIKNRGSGTITLNAASGSTIYDTATQSTISITAGQACQLLPDGTYFLVMFKQ